MFAHNTTHRSRKIPIDVRSRKLRVQGVTRKALAPQWDTSALEFRMQEEQANSEWCIPNIFLNPSNQTRGTLTKHFRLSKYYMYPFSNLDSNYPLPQLLTYSTSGY